MMTRMTRLVPAAMIHADASGTVSAVKRRNAREQIASARVATVTGKPTSRERGWVSTTDTQPLACRRSTGEEGGSAMARITQARRDEMAESMKSLREVLADIDVIYTDVVHVSASGMFRCIRPFIITEERRPWDLTYLVARAGIGKASERHGGIEMGGTGMDMGFALVYEIGRGVHGDGAPCRCRGARCAH